MEAKTTDMTATTVESLSIDSDHEPTRLQRKRAECLDRTLARNGFVRDYHVEVGPSGITGHIRAPARLIRQSLAPVLRARDLGWSYSDADTTPATRRVEGIVTIQLWDKQGE